MRQQDDAGAGPRSLKPLDDIPAGYVGKPRGGRLRQARAPGDSALDARTSPGDAGALGMTYELPTFDEPRRLKPHAWNIDSSTL